MLLFVEDVGRHNAIDTIAGWMWMAPTLPTACGSLHVGGAATPADRQSRIHSPGLPGNAAPEPNSSKASAAGLVFYTTGRLTSEMVIKSAQMGVAVVVSRSGVTQMGHQVAEAVGLCAIGRATNKRFLCYSHVERLKFQPDLIGMAPSPSVRRQE